MERFEPSGIRSKRRAEGPVRMAEPGTRPVEFEAGGKGVFGEWSVTTGSGRKVTMAPAVGSGGYVPPELDARMQASLLNGLADAYERDMRRAGPPKIAVHSIQGMAQTLERELGYDQASAWDAAQGFRAAVISNNQGTIHVVPEVLAKGYNSSGWLIEAHERAADPLAGTMAHEYGHIRYYDADHTLEGQQTNSKLNALWHDRRVKESMSDYGNTNQMEGYAEAYAEWTLTGGTTRNAAARLFAAAFGWP